MRNTKFGASRSRWLTILFVLQLTVIAEGRAQLADNIESRVRAAVLVVATEKTESNSIIYEKPLPVERLPAGVKSHDYDPIGLAFLLGENKYVTVAHTLRLGLKSRKTPPVLRDVNGNIFHIDRILKYSYEKDFVVFTTKEQNSAPGLIPNPALPTTQLFSVARNAFTPHVDFQEVGLQIRQPDERDGSWYEPGIAADLEYGNSGGPVVDKNGSVVGMARKSLNRNLYSHIPIAEILDATDTTAVINAKFQVRVKYLVSVEQGILKEEISLPKTWDKFNSELISLQEEFRTKLLNRLISANSTTMLASAAASSYLLDIQQYPSRPAVIQRDGNDNWNIAASATTFRRTLENNAVFDVAPDKELILFRLRRPDNISHAALFGDSKLFMDLVLSAIPFKRPYGNQNIRLVSIGEASSENVYLDMHERKWKVFTWPFDFSDGVLIVLALPLPDGYAAMMALVPSSMEKVKLLSFKALANLVYVSYDASLENWRAFLEQKALLPAIFSDLNISFEYGREFHYQSKRLDMSLPGNSLPLSNSSYLALQFAYFAEDKKWDVSGLKISDSIKKAREYWVKRNPTPSEDFPNEWKSRWKKQAEKQHPYDEIITVDNTTTEIATTRSLKRSNGTSPNIIYLY